MQDSSTVPIKSISILTMNLKLVTPWATDLERFILKDFTSLKELISSPTFDENVVSNKGFGVMAALRISPHRYNIAQLHINLTNKSKL